MRRINRCLNARLTEICQKSLMLDQINAKLSLFLSDTLQKHCYVGSFNGGCLLLMVTDPVWASELRYALPELRDKLRREAGIYQLSSIKIAIASSDNQLPQNKGKKTSLSPKAYEIIQASAEQCEYLPLKAVLLKLAKHFPVK